MLKLFETAYNLYKRNGLTVFESIGKARQEIGFVGKMNKADLMKMAEFIRSGAYARARKEYGKDI